MTERARVRKREKSVRSRTGRKKKEIKLGNKKEKRNGK